MGGRTSWLLIKFHYFYDRLRCLGPVINIMNVIDVLDVIDVLSMMSVMTPMQ